MSEIFSFTCSSCGEIHEGSPSFGFNAPAPFLEQPKDIQSNGELTTDLCHYDDEDGAHYFIRVTIEVPIHGAEEAFMWGVWVSLSKDSYEHYVETYDEPDINKVYFGWFSNYLPYYEQTYALATDVHPRADGERPYLDLHETDNSFYKDYINGVTIEKAQEIAELCMHG